MDEHLESLLVDQSKVDTQRLASALKGAIGIDTNTGQPVIGERFHELKPEVKLLAILLGQLAAHLVGLQQTERLALKELQQLSGLPSGTVAPAARRLLNERKLVEQGQDRKYFVPRTKVILAAAMVAPHDE